jgi:hypothetical protein
LWYDPFRAAVGGCSETHGGTTGKFGIDDDMLGQDPRAFAVALSKTIPEFSTESSK